MTHWSEQPEGGYTVTPPQWLIGDAKRVRSVEEVLTLVRSIMVEDNRFFVLMAKHLQISQKHMSQIMVGNAKLSAQRMLDILDYLGQDVWVERREPPK